MRLVIATGNQGKAREFREMLAGAWTDTRSSGGSAGDSGGAGARGGAEWSDLSAHGDIPTVEETGHTFRANACLKATYYATRLKAWALADDSGLMVDALGGAPGVLSARWAQVNHAGSGDADNNATLLRQLRDVPDDRRGARFMCVLALADPRGRIILTAQDAVEGVILREPRGTNGFGYDPLFLIPPLGKTTAELAPDEKHAISHRGRALRRLRVMMDENLPRLGGA